MTDLRVKLHHYDEVIDSVKTKGEDNETCFIIPGNGWVNEHTL